MTFPTLLVLNPNASADMTAAIDRIARQAAGERASIETRYNPAGPHVIETPADRIACVPGALEAIRNVGLAFDAVVLACFGDPGIEEVRAAVKVPVTGIGVSSFLQASMIGRFAIVSPRPGTPERFKALTERLGIADRFVGTYNTGLPVAAFEADAAETYATLLAHARRAVADGAECLLFGCAGIADQVARIQAEVGVACIASVAAGVAQALACLSHRPARRQVSPLRG
ncbi:MAG: hypothetical protein EXQ96_10030 [Alphaproteobacteria bacterium]|nr:hypothetical protein [Alphaproteobacteria bacterium]